MFQSREDGRPLTTDRRKMGVRGERRAAGSELRGAKGESEKMTCYSSFVVRRPSFFGGLPSAVCRLLFPFLLLFAFAGCYQQMANQPKYNPMDPSDFFPNGSSAQTQVPDTVARGQLRDDTLLFTGKVNGQDATVFPYPITSEVMQRGQQRFNIYCSPCHGETGQGNGMIVQRGYSPPPSFHQDRLRCAPVGHFFDVITNGLGAMPSYASQIPAVDRWTIIAYIRALQLSENAPYSDVPADQQAQLGTPSATPSGPTPDPCVAFTQTPGAPGTPSATGTSVPLLSGPTTQPSATAATAGVSPTGTLAPGASATTTAGATETEAPARPSNPGGPGAAVNLTGNATNGAQLFTTNCQQCHGPQGKGGVPNPGSTDGTVPPLNPIDPTILSQDPKVFAYNVDLFVEHGSTPDGSNPKLVMPAWGDQKLLTPQQIADVIAYIISLNQQ